MIINKISYLKAEKRSGRRKGGRVHALGQTAHAMESAWHFHRGTSGVTPRLGTDSLGTHHGTVRPTMKGKTWNAPPWDPVKELQQLGAAQSRRAELWGAPPAFVPCPGEVWQGCLSPGRWAWTETAPRQGGRGTCSKTQMPEDTDALRLLPSLPEPWHGSVPQASPGRTDQPSSPGAHLMVQWNP